MRIKCCILVLISIVSVGAARAMEDQLSDYTYEEADVEYSSNSGELDLPNTVVDGMKCNFFTINEKDPLLIKAVLFELSKVHGPTINGISLIEAGEISDFSLLAPFPNLEILALGQYKQKNLASLLRYVPNLKFLNVSPDEFGDCVFIQVSDLATNPTNLAIIAGKSHSELYNFLEQNVGLLFQKQDEAQKLMNALVIEYLSIEYLSSIDPSELFNDFDK